MSDIDTLRSTADVAAALDITPGRVRQLARALGLGRQTAGGRVYGNADLALLRGRKTRPGPDKGIARSCENTSPNP